MRILILGGSTEASQLAREIAGSSAYSAVLSLAGRTMAPSLPPIPSRVGGFGGVAGLISYLRLESIELVIDATHPFAEQMSANAQAACREADVPLVVFTRPPWKPETGDRWIETANVTSAALAIGDRPRRVFLTVGRLQLAGFESASHHDYLIRTIDPPDPAPRLPRYRLLQARGPFTFHDEVQLISTAGIEVIVTKNSGGAAARAKLDAARECGIDVILVRPPPRSNVATFYELKDLLRFLHHTGTV